MRLPSGYGGVVKLKGNRRKPYQVRLTKGFTDEGKQIYMYLGYYAKRSEALEALAEYRSNPYDITRETITFAEVYKKWSNEHFKKVSSSSIERYSNAYRKYCKSLYKMRFKDIRLTHLQAVIDNCGKAHPTRASIKTLFNVLFSFAMKNDIVDKDYAQYVDIGQREGKINRKPFTQEEIDKLFKYVDTFEYLDTILIMIYSGLRIGELLDLRIKNIHLKDRYMIGGNKTKAGKNRIIPISKKTEPFIKKYYETNKDKEFLIINSFCVMSIIRISLCGILKPLKGCSSKDIMCSSISSLIAAFKCVILICMLPLENPNLFMPLNNVFMSFLVRHSTGISLIMDIMTLHV